MAPSYSRPYCGKQAREPSSAGPDISLLRPELQRQWHHAKNHQLGDRQLLPTPERPLSSENVPRSAIAPGNAPGAPTLLPDSRSLLWSAALGVVRPLRPARALCPSQRWHRFHLIAPRESGSLGICTELLLRLFPRGQRGAAPGP